MSAAALRRRMYYRLNVMRLHVRSRNPFGLPCDDAEVCIVASTTRSPSRLGSAPKPHASGKWP
jgi:hypothetical protein